MSLCEKIHYYLPLPLPLPPNTPLRNQAIDYLFISYGALDHPILGSKVVSREKICYEIVFPHS